MFVNRKEMSWSDKKQGTTAVWSGENTLFFEGATQVPVVHSVSYGFKDCDEWYDVALGKKEGHIYGRNTNPTVKLFEEKMCILEEAEASTSFATGMAAISNTLFALLAPGKRVVSLKDTYGGTSRVFLDFFPVYHIEAQLCDTTDHDQIESEIAKGCDLLYLETPTNPTLKVVDLERLIKAGKQVGAIIVVDNTFATPINQRPLALGADLVVHSATKFIGGHADAMAGVVCGKKELVEKVFRYREINGATLHPMAAYLMIRGLKTLELRVQRCNESALKIAQFLETHPQVEAVYYPGLESNEGHEIARKQMSGYGGVLSFSLKGGFDDVKRMMPELKLAFMAAHLGGTSTVVGPPRTTSHVETTVEQRKELGIPEGLVRYAVGVENVEDLISDLNAALNTL
jgi:cystathionine gamma-synthase